MFFFAKTDAFLLNILWQIIFNIELLMKISCVNFLYVYCILLNHLPTIFPRWFIGSCNSKLSNLLIPVIDCCSREFFKSTSSLPSLFTDIPLRNLKTDRLFMDRSSVNRTSLSASWVPPSVRMTLPRTFISTIRNISVFIIKCLVDFFNKQEISIKCPSEIIYRTIRRLQMNQKFVIYFILFWFCFILILSFSFFIYFIIVMFSN